LLILRSERSGDAGVSDSSPVSLAPAKPAPDALARSRVHMRTRESVSHHTNAAVISLADINNFRGDFSDKYVGDGHEQGVEKPVANPCVW